MKKILIIEDDIGIAGLMKLALHNEGYKVTLAHTGQQALEHLLQFTYDLVVLDITLSDMKAMEIIAQLEQEEKQMPAFIVATSRDDTAFAVEMMKAGAYYYMVKDRHVSQRLLKVIKLWEKDVQKEELLQKTQQALEQSEMRFRSFVENPIDLFMKINNAGEFVYVSPNAEEIMGYKPEEILGKHFADIILQEDQEDVMTEFNRVVDEENLSCRVDYRIKNGQGQLRYHLAKGYSVKENGELYINCIARDVTESREAEKWQANRILQAEEKEKKLFAEKLHEELGPLVSSIKLYMSKIKKLESNLEKDHEVIDYCDMLVDDAVTRIRDLANDLMPNVLIDFGLEKALFSYFEKFEQRNDIQIDFAYSKPPEKPSHICKVLFYRAVVALLNYSQSIAGLDKVTVSLQYPEGRIRLVYKDNRKAYSIKDFWNSKNEKNLELKNMKHKIESFEGSMLVKANKDLGLLVEIVLPQSI